MKKTARRVLTLILAAILTVSVLSLTALADYEAEKEFTPEKTDVYLVRLYADQPKSFEVDGGRLLYTDLELYGHSQAYVYLEEGKTCTLRGTAFGGCKINSVSPQNMTPLGMEGTSFRPIPTPGATEDAQYPFYLFTAPEAGTYVFRSGGYGLSHLKGYPLKNNETLAGQFDYDAYLDGTYVYFGGGDVYRLTCEMEQGEQIILHTGVEEWGDEVRVVIERIGGAEPDEPETPDEPQEPEVPDESETPNEPETPDEPTDDPEEDIPAEGIAVASTQEVEVDGVKYVFEMYALLNKEGNPTNYVKLRDVAYILNSTQARFNVTWTPADGIGVVTGTHYASNGSEMNTPFSGDQPYKLLAGTTSVNGTPQAIQAIQITWDDLGYTYYKLRDLGEYLGFHVDWALGRGVYVETDKYYGGAPK